LPWYLLVHGLRTCTVARPTTLLCVPMPMLYETIRTSFFPVRSRVVIA